MACTLKLPVGIDSFEKIRRNKFYYIDKTKLIEQLVETGGEVTLFTRPRRFGKTLNMSMLKAFFETGADESLFDGLYIAQNKALCEEHMGKYPVIFLSLKSVEGLKYEDARYRITELIGIEAERFGFLEDSEYLSENEKKRYKAIIALKDGTNAMDEKVLVSSLQILSQLLYKHFGQKTVILIDEYDVPLDKAFQNGYYKEMVSLIRGLFGQALKTNEFLQFAVLTGCLRVSKESIFTGLNNFEINSIVDIAHDEQFGFTDDEVRKLLLDYDRSERYPDVKEWYDGYHFGNTDIYCPWDVINFAKKLVWDPSARPSAFWINSSGNDMVKRFVDKADQTTRDEIEKLVAGGFVEKQLRLDLTYDEIDNTIDNLWSVLFTTGYLTKAGEVRLPDSGSYAYKLVIPNKEVREVFVLQIQEWFKAVVAKDDDTMKLLSRAILDKDEKQIARQLNIVMSRMISILDTKAPDAMKENFYHGLLLGLLRGSNPDWLIKSNRESGDGFSDILIMPEDPDAGIVIEVKYAKEMKELDAACEAAITQIKDKRYDGLFLLPAAQTRDKDAVSPEQMQKLCDDLKEEGFDFIVLDCPAGIEQGFKNAIAGADRAIVVTTPEVSAVRDADRIIGLLEANELRNPTLILNRLRIDLVQRGEMMNIEDVEEILAIDILGVVPDDESIVIATNKGEPAVMNENSKAGQAYRNIVQRLLGNDVPLMSFEPEPETFMDKLKKLFRK